MPVQPSSVQAALGPMAFLFRLSTDGKSVCGFLSDFVRSAQCGQASSTLECRSARVLFMVG